MDLLQWKGKASDSCCSILKILICLWCVLLKRVLINFVLSVFVSSDEWINLLLFFVFVIRMLKGINQVFGTKLIAIQVSNYSFIALVNGLM